MKSALFRLALLAFCLSGCALLPERHHLIDLSPYPDTIQLDVPFFEQSDELCGPAAMAMLLAWHGVDVDLDLLHQQIYTQGLGGSLQQDMLGSARRHGLLAIPFNTVDELFLELSHGTPVILLLNLGFVSWPQWHYVVVTGMNTISETAIIHDGQTANREIPLSRLLQQWYRGDRWGLVVTLPEQIPASADSDELLHAVVGLERANQLKAAFSAYRSATSIYPDFSLFWIGRGNTALALQDYNEAELAFTRAIELDSQNGAAYHNLAAALHAQGQDSEALKIISTGRANAINFHEALSSLEHRIRNRKDNP